MTTPHRSPVGGPAEPEVPLSVEERILMALAKGRLGGMRFCQIRLAVQTEERHTSYREVDGALQKLRRAGKIHYFSPVVGWRIGPAKEPA